MSAEDERLRSADASQITSQNCPTYRCPKCETKMVRGEDMDVHARRGRNEAMSDEGTRGFYVTDEDRKNASDVLERVSFYCKEIIIPDPDRFVAAVAHMLGAIRTGRPDAQPKSEDHRDLCLRRIGEILATIDGDTEVTDRVGYAINRIQDVVTDSWSGASPLRSPEAKPWDPFASYAANLKDGRDPATCPHPSTRVDFGADYCHGCARVVPEVAARKDVCGECAHDRMDHEDEDGCTYGAHNYTCECPRFVQRRERAQLVECWACAGTGRARVSPFGNPHPMACLTCDGSGKTSGQAGKPADPPAPDPSPVGSPEETGTTSDNASDGKVKP